MLEPQGKVSRRQGALFPFSCAHPLLLVETCTWFGQESMEAITGPEEAPLFQAALQTQTGGRGSAPESKSICLHPGRQWMV